LQKRLLQNCLGTEVAKGALLSTVLRCDLKNSLTEFVWLQSVVGMFNSLFCWELNLVAKASLSSSVYPCDFENSLTEFVGLEDVLVDSASGIAD